MKDAYGNTSDQVALDLTYDRDTLEKINYDEVESRRVWDLAKTSPKAIHPDLQG